MYVDIQSLETFSRLASEGASTAAESLGQLTGTDVYVDVTDVTLMAAGDLRDTFAGREFVGVEVGLEGGIVGQTVMAFETDAAEVLLDKLMPGDGSIDDEAFARSGVQEAGNIMTSGFIDGWADHLGVGIDMTPPAYVRATGTDILPDGAFETDRSGVFMFESKIRSLSDELEFTIYMLPEYAGFTDMLRRSRGGENSPAIPVDKLPEFNQMTKQGATSAADNITMMTGTETDVEVSRLRFVPIQDVPSEVGDETVAGTIFELHGEPSGYLAILFDEASAEQVAQGMIPTETEPGIGEMERGALRELGNIMTSGFIDGWANVLNTSIEHTPPQFIHDMGSAVMDPLVSRLGRTQEHAFIIDSTVRTPDGDVRCDIYALPDQHELAEALDQIDTGTSDHVGADGAL
jgi:chemotaxis protein CheY-P-specific phosphatase CheC